MKVLNLYAGIGGNRKLWEDVEVTAVEYEPTIAEIYKDFFPDDKVIVADAHQYLQKHYEEFDFIWSSPPCPTHSRLNTSFNNEQRKHQLKFPDMRLYEEIIFLKHFYKGLYCIENVISYYNPLIPPQEINNHYFWMNFYVPERRSKTRNHDAIIEQLQEFKGFDLSKYKGIDKRKALRNCVEPETAKHILNFARNPIKLQGALL